MTKRYEKCELCGRRAPGKYYSWEGCNGSGTGVTLHRQCAVWLDGVHPGLAVGLLARGPSVSAMEDAKSYYEAIQAKEAPK